MGDITAFDENLVRMANSSHFSSPQECLEVFKVSVSLMIYGIETPYPLNHPAWMIWEYYCCGRQAWANSWWDSYPPSWTIRTCSDSSFWPLSFSVLEISTRESPPLPIHPPSPGRSSPQWLVCVILPEYLHSRAPSPLVRRICLAVPLNGILKLCTVSNIHCMILG